MYVHKHEYGTRAAASIGAARRQTIGAYTSGLSSSCHRSSCRSCSLARDFGLLLCSSCRSGLPRTSAPLRVSPHAAGFTAIFCVLSRFKGDQMQRAELTSQGLGWHGFGPLKPARGSPPCTRSRRSSLARHRASHGWRRPPIHRRGPRRTAPLRAASASKRQSTTALERPRRPRATDPQVSARANPWDELGVPPDASEKQVKRAYRKLALK